MKQYANGGFITGPPLKLRVECPGLDAAGHRLYSIAGGELEHIQSAAESMAGDVSKLTCPLRVVVKP